jgi:prepilin-type N-terminal cleavage/methylation domain-containing protein
MSFHPFSRRRSRSTIHNAGSNPKARLGFTIVEVLLVVAIIAVLGGLIVSFIFRMGSKGKEVQTTDEIRQLEAAVENFKSYYKVTYVPSHILLREDGNYQVGGVDTLEADSLKYLKRVWPNLKFPVDIDGDGKFDGIWELEGDQCLVFFLGGMQSFDGNVPACLGFSTDRTNPWNRNPNIPRREPFFEFKTNRLIFARSMPGRELLQSRGPFFTYLDPYGESNGQGQWQSGSPFAYISSYGVRNGYNRYYQPKQNWVRGTDCGNIDGKDGHGVWPYAEAIDANGNVRYVNPSSFQIISAGGDTKFGIGSDLTQKVSNIYLWNANTASSISPDGKDDRSNFAQRTLSVGP